MTKEQQQTAWFITAMLFLLIGFITNWPVIFAVSTWAMFNCAISVHSKD